LPEEKKPGGLRKLYLAVACALCGEPMGVPLSENAHEGQDVSVLCWPCAHEMQVTITEDNLREIDGESS